MRAFSLALIAGIAASAALLGCDTAPGPPSRSPEPVIAPEPFATVHGDTVRVVTIAGSSNLVNAYCSSVLTPAPPRGSTYAWTGAQFAPVDDCADAEFTGGMAYAFASAYFDRGGAGPLLFVQTAKRGSYLLPYAGVTEWWLPGGGLFEAAVAKTEAAVAHASANGLVADYVGVLWGQGNDQDQIAAGVVTADAYFAGLDRLMSAWETYRPEGRFLITNAFTDVRHDTAIARAFRARERASCAAHPYCVLAAAETDYTVERYRACATSGCRRAWFYDGQIHWGFAGLARVGGAAGVVTAGLE
jgi:hypothetical protein